MSYDTFNFNPKKILEYCESLKTKDLQIEYLKNVRIDYHQMRSAKGIPSIDCDTFEDTTKPEGGLDDEFIRWIYNEIQRRKFAKTKYKRKTARLEEIRPNELYPRATVAELVGRDVRTIKNWIVGVSVGKRKKLQLLTKSHGGEERIYGRDILKFLEEWDQYKEKKLGN